MNIPAPAHITCSCPVCGTQTLPGTAFTLVKCDWNPDRSFYFFTCPKCTEPVIKQASVRVIHGLGARGVRTVAFPAEVLEAAEQSGSPLTTDDLLDFLTALSDDATLATAISTLGAA